MKIDHESNPPQGNLAPVNELHKDPKLENSGNGGATGPSRNPGKRKQGPTLHERLTQQETQFQSFAERVLTQLDVLQRRFDENPQQQRSEGAVQGQTIMGTQMRERVATHGRAANIDDQTVGQGGHVGGDRQDPYGGHRVERLPRKEQDRKDTNVFHQQHPPSFSGGDNTEAENWLLAINKILEFSDCPDRQKVMRTAGGKPKRESLKNGLDESIRDMVMDEPCETYSKAVDREMWAEKAVTQFSKMFVKRKEEADKDPRAKGPRIRINEVIKRNATDATGAIWDAATSNQGLVISAEKPDIDQRTALVEWYVIDVICQDILRGFVLRRKHQAHSSRKTKTDHQDDRQHDNRMCRIQEGGSKPTCLHLTLGRHKSRQVG
ncbi:hypothetical protein ACLOJK_005421 [Asimina triloba]